MFKKLALVLLSVAMTVLCLVGCGKAADAERPGSTEDQTEAEAVFSIETDYGTLKYPSKWEKDVEVTASGDNVDFSLKSDGSRIFSLRFNNGNGYLLGALPVDNKKIPVYVDNAELDKKAENFETLAEMQEGVNVILQNLIKDYNFDVNGTSDAEENPEVYEIKTSVASLYYPKRWEDKVTVEESEGSIVFLSDKVKLFELKSGGEDGFLIGKYKGKPLRLVTYSFSKYEDDKARFEELCAMQEDSNTIIRYLEKDSDFVTE